MPGFVHSPLLWGMLIVGVPVLIHLINMLRHRRVQWAAMEFLLESQRKNRTWVLLKQLLLLLARMLAIAAVVLMVAGPILSDRLGRLLGSSKTHHVVLLDDSFSMSDRWGQTSAINEAKKVVERIGVEAGRQVQPQVFTLLRFSQAERQDQQSTQPDLIEETVDADFVDRLGNVLGSLTASQTAAGPTRAVEALDQLLGQSDDERRIVYVVSDFRARQWDKPADLRQKLGRLEESGARICLVNCVEAARPNLAISALHPTAGTKAAGVPLGMEVALKNFSTEAAKDVSVLLESDGHSRPAVSIAEIPPEAEVKERFEVHFPTAGAHQITAQLAGDAVNADNSRYSVVDLPLGVPVLIVDGGPQARNARYLSFALAPGGPRPTGISPQIESPRYLDLSPLDGFHVVYLANVERLDPSAIEALERYARRGGGVGIFLGPKSAATFINEQLYREGQGLFPLPLAGPVDLLVDRLEPAPDMEVGRHPIFRVFAGRQNSAVSTVTIYRYFAAAADWKPEADSGTRVIAQLRNGAPLSVERGFGEGRVVTFLTTAAPDWNNWARNNPTFVVAVQQMQAYLSRRPAAAVDYKVGAPLKLELAPAQYEPAVRFSKVGEDAAAVTTQAVVRPDGLLSALLAETDTSGIYEAWLTRTGNAQPEVRRYAFNVEAAEGDLQRLTGTQLASRLGGLRYVYEQASSFRYTAEESAGGNLSQALLYFLILLLIGEQILAHSASYHRPVGAGGGSR